MKEARTGEPSEKRKTAIIIGAGPAGLTAAYELARNSRIRPVIFEATPDIGGLSRTVDFQGNKLDLGGHRFFSKSDRINAWWESILPLEDEKKANPEFVDEVMLIRKRLSRIYFLEKLFSYPIQLNTQTFSNLGLRRTMKIALSYVRIRLSREEEIQTLEDLFIHRFGRELYRTFFKSYTEKVWGVSCRDIQPEWGSQRIKNLSVAKTILHGLKENFLSVGNTTQKSTETSLITRFHYPKYGPGQLWNRVAEDAVAAGGEIRTNCRVVAVRPLEDGRFRVSLKNKKTGKTAIATGEYVLSSMPVKELIAGLDAPVPADVRSAAEGLMYRDFVLVGLLLRKLLKVMPDQWIYIQESDIKMGRLQVFNNWSPYLLRDRTRTLVGAEYFCTEGDTLWNLSEERLVSMAAEELARMGFIDGRDVMDGIVIKQVKAYPAYFGTYDRFHVIRNYLDSIDNLFPVGRNGMHRYNNMDHSMMSAMLVVENILGGVGSKENVWEINARDELHEGKT